MAAIIMVAMFTACNNDDNPVRPKPFNDDGATLVTNDQELRNAIKDGASIKLGNDIDLSNSTLSIAEGTKVTINLGGHTLDRKLTQRGEGGGQVITVRESATLNLSNGTLKGGWGGNAGGLSNEAGTANLTNVTITDCTGDDKGGAICNLSGGTLTIKGGSITGNTSFDKDDPTGGGALFNAEGATATLTDVTVTGNQAKLTGGGGICNYGTLTLDGCTITGNTCGKNGGGIYNYSTATLNMQGKNTITDNTGKDGLKHNVFLKKDAVITVTGALTDSKIGISLEEQTGTFTSGYKKNNNDVAPATVFTSDLTGVMAVSADDNNEAQLGNALPDGSVYYIERTWDDASKSVKAEIKIIYSNNYIVLQGGDEVKLGSGTFIVMGDVKYNRILCLTGDEHNIILCDGAKLESRFLQVEDNNSLHIYGQNKNSGKLVASEDYLRHAAIGGDKNKTNGPIFIHGGDIYAKGSPGSAGIGGGYFARGGDITIYGGKIEAIGGRHHEDVDGNSDYEWGGGAGIGGGWNGNGGNVTIYGGEVKASGTANGAGIGGGGKAWDSGGVNGGTLTVMGGTVKCYGGEESAGIGGGYNGDGGNVTVNGGSVYAYGALRAAGIGGGRDANGGTLTVNGGYVYVLGGVYAAGIGSGCEATFNDGLHGGTVIVTGGKVEAYGGVDGAGIGGGEDADGGNVTITGGVVIAKAGVHETGHRAIGPGEDSDNYGELTIGDDMMVSSERLANVDERKNMCWYRTQVRVEPCTHPGYTADTCPYHKH